MTQTYRAPAKKRFDFAKVNDTGTAFSAVWRMAGMYLGGSVLSWVVVSEDPAPIVSALNRAIGNAPAVRLPGKVIAEVRDKRREITVPGRSRLVIGNKYFELMNTLTSAERDVILNDSFLLADVLHVLMDEREQGRRRAIQERREAILAALALAQAERQK
ncbi:hypothetical protein JSO19_00125 [Leucobacter sp. UCMA 4100]|uniref:hypothetical protein n=1 Tax=Leucobacter sp. UCMA 4100 TaxID=2810534 RepID=UPI0022EAAD86|nr:hypothetical protein [Leucobacter sp. UCMA 4100]MDA3145784.1 hypothetical protein [Leucobacter sp. UCMA 4100]